MKRSLLFRGILTALVLAFAASALLFWQQKVGATVRP